MRLWFLFLLAAPLALAQPLTADKDTLPPPGRENPASAARDTTQTDSLKRRGLLSEDPIMALRKKVPKIDTAMFVYKYFAQPIITVIRWPIEGALGDSGLVLEYVAHPVAKVLTWPIEKIVVPGLETVFYPTRAPFEYVIEEQVIERALEVARFGPGDAWLLYPTLNLTTGAGSQTGLTFHNEALFGRPSKKLALQYRYYVNRDQKFRTQWMAANVFGSDLNARITTNHNRAKNNPISQPRNATFSNYADSTDAINLDLTYPLGGPVTARFFSGIRFSHLRSSPWESQTIVCDDGYFFESGDCTARRGLDQDFEDYSLGAGLQRNTVDNSNIPTSGSKTDLMASYHLTTQNHDYFNWSLRYQKYLFLGVERYEISAQEQKQLGSFSFKKVKKLLDVRTLRKELFHRKVIAMQYYMARSYERPGHDAPLYALYAISNGTPMRGFVGSPYRDWAISAFSLEYRFPVMRLVEGTLFDEWAVVDRDFPAIVRRGKVKNCWGFGIRVARKNIFLSRIDVGFQGLMRGVVFNVSVDPAF